MPLGLEGHGTMNQQKARIVSDYPWFPFGAKVIHLHEASDHEWLLSPESKFLRAETLCVKIQNAEAAPHPKSFFPPLRNNGGNWSLNLPAYKEQLTILH